MSRLRVRKIARAEFVAAFEWYLDRSPAAAQQFLHAVDEAMSVIEKSPERFPVIRGFRRILLRRFPYAVYYKVFPSTISVVGVIHGAPTSGLLVAACCALTNTYRCPVLPLP